MAGVSVKSLRKEYRSGRSVVAVDDVTLDVRDGEMLVLLGPSGCGKTTTLRCLAGLEAPTGGSVHFGDRPVFDERSRVNVAPERRDVGMVFQSYALWPHKTVEENIAYPLRARRLKRELKELGWVQEAARAVGCEELLSRYPGQLSGGQQQRVALARALVARPAVVLFDEPLSNLDARLRDSVRAEIHELHRRIGFTGVYVTHDQSEAFALGDRVAVMRAGGVEQLGSPDEVYERPGTEYVAEFVGFLNKVALKRSSGDSWTSDVGPVAGYQPSTFGPTSTANLRVRPDDLYVEAGPGPRPGACALGEGVVTDFSYGGRHLDVSVRFGDNRLRAHYALEPGETRDALSPGQTVTLSFNPRRALIFPTSEAPDGQDGPAEATSSPAEPPLSNPIAS